MNFQQTLDYLYGNLPMYQRIGTAAFKKDLSNTIALCTHLGNPQTRFKSIHVGGTNGKGSSSHMIASVLQSAGYKVGLYTSPHLKSFTERIRINGKEMEEDAVVQFVKQHRATIDAIQPSFFEMTVAMAFAYFADQQVDFAVVEVGLGGRLDSTNIILPEISLITNISYDHQAMLGNTLAEIAFEKAGIIKKNIPVVISEYQTETASVFLEKSKEMETPLYFASKEYQVTLIEKLSDKMRIKVDTENKFSGELILDLTGSYQLLNIPGVLKTLELLSYKYPSITFETIIKGISTVKVNTGLKGRWQILQRNPVVICDTGHNEAGIKLVIEQLKLLNPKKLLMIMGMVNDKPAEKILKLLPKQAYYYFCEANIPRALDAVQLYSAAQQHGLVGEVEKDVNRAIKKAVSLAGKDDVIFVGGSSFVVAEINGL